MTEMRDVLTRNLADRIHQHHCFENHTDGCGYFYAEWGKEARWTEADRRSKEKMYALAQRLLDRFGRDTILSYMHVHKAIDSLAREIRTP